MLDPVPCPPAWLRETVEPWALRFNLPVLADHCHEVITVFIVYLFIHYVLSPWLSAKLFPRHYPNLNKRTQLNWNVHVVSLVQSTFICAVALWVLFTDEERMSMSSGERVLGYSGACALISSLAVGYFIYDLIVSTIYVKMFGIGMLFHAISALWVFSFGFVSTRTCVSMRTTITEQFHRDRLSTSMLQPLSFMSSLAPSSIFTGSWTSST